MSRTISPETNNSVVQRIFLHLSSKLRKKPHLYMMALHSRTVGSGWILTRNSSCEDGETPRQVTKRSCECPIPGSVQSQIGSSPEQPGPVRGAPAHGRGPEVSVRSLSTQAILQLSDSMFLDNLFGHTRLKGVLQWDGIKKKSDIQYN